jgi:hypothetical protein
VKPAFEIVDHTARAQKAFGIGVRDRDPKGLLEGEHEGDSV